MPGLRAQQLRRLFIRFFNAKGFVGIQARGLESRISAPAHAIDLGLIFLARLENKRSGARRSQAGFFSKNHDSISTILESKQSVKSLESLGEAKRAESENPPTP